MDNKWISVSEALATTGKSEITIRRYISEHKNDKKVVGKKNGKILINTEFLYQTYQPVNDISDDSAIEESKHKKEAMQIAYNSEIIKRKDEHLTAKDRQIELLINKKSYLPFWLTVGFVILIVALGYLGFLYRSELINNFKSRIANIRTNYQGKFDYQAKALTKAQEKLDETTVAWQQSLKAIDTLHAKYNDKLDQKDTQYKKELGSLKKQILQLQQE